MSKMAIVEHIQSNFGRGDDFDRIPGFPAGVTGGDGGAPEAAANEAGRLRLVYHSGLHCF